jgi:hypothetical protein
VSTDNCYWPFKKLVPSSSRSFHTALENSKLYTSTKLLWKPQIWQGQKPYMNTHTHTHTHSVHAHTAPNYIFTCTRCCKQGWALSRQGLILRSMFFLNALDMFYNKNNFPPWFWVTTAFAFQFGSLFPINTGLTKLKPGNIQQWMAPWNVVSINPLLLLFNALLHGQKDRVFFSGHLIYILKQERCRAFRLARDIYIPSTLER